MEEEKHSEIWQTEGGGVFGRLDSKEDTVVYARRAKLRGA